MKSFNELKKNLKRDYSELKTVKLAVLGDTATQLLVQAIKGSGFEKSINLEIFEAEYDQVNRQVLDPDSELYNFDPDYVLIFYCAKKLETKFFLSDKQSRNNFWESVIYEFERQYQNIISRNKCRVIISNFPEVPDSVFCNYANKTDLSFLYQLRRINIELMHLAHKDHNLFILDLCAVQNLYGWSFLNNNRIYVNTDIALSVDSLPVISRNLLDMINSIEGKFKKCLIIDLDNTLWGGVIGDDGIENIQIGDLGIGKAFSEFQLWIKQLKERGIILTICSKNDEAVAKEPFLKHPEMILRLDDISVFVANWENKVDNIRKIQSILNIGFESMVFLDDSPFERNIVRENMKDIFVPELPEDPSEYLEYLSSLNIFETASFTEEDSERTQMYREEAERSLAYEKFSNENEFLKSLGMNSRVETINSYNTPRIAQLTQRSNQFNLRTIRYTEDDIKRIYENKNYITRAFNLKDKFGNYGLIGIIILEVKNNSELFIDTWIMSCRVLKRGMENFMLNCIVNDSMEKGFSRLVGQYIPTLKNNMVKDHYEKLGFTKKDEFWSLAVRDYKERECYINIEMSNDN
jgi:FkbH-like protein